MKTWLVEQVWAVGNLKVPVQNHVVAKSRKKAKKGAKEACKQAALALGAAKIGAKPKGKPQVLHAV